MPGGIFFSSTKYRNIYMLPCGYFIIFYYIYYILLYLLYFIIFIIFHYIFTRQSM